MIFLLEHEAIAVKQSQQRLQKNLHQLDSNLTRVHGKLQQVAREPVALGASFAAGVCSGYAVDNPSPKNGAKFLAKLPLYASYFL